MSNELLLKNHLPERIPINPELKFEFLTIHKITDLGEYDLRKFKNLISFDDYERIIEGYLGNPHKFLSLNSYKNFTHYLDYYLNEINFKGEGVNIFQKSRLEYYKTLNCADVIYHLNEENIFIELLKKNNLVIEKYLYSGEFIQERTLNLFVKKGMSGYPSLYTNPIYLPFKAKIEGTKFSISEKYISIIENSINLGRMEHDKTLLIFYLNFFKFLFQKDYASNETDFENKFSEYVQNLWKLAARGGKEILIK